MRNLNLTPKGDQCSCGSYSIRHRKDTTQNDIGLITSSSGKETAEQNRLDCQQLLKRGAHASRPERPVEIEPKTEI